MAFRFDKLTIKAQEAVAAAQSLATERGNSEIDSLHLLFTLIDEEEATLKRFRRRGASIALEPANTSYEVRILPPNRVRIQGKLVGLFRRY